MIKVGEIDVGIMGLNRVFQEIATLGITDETRLKDELVASVRKAGNYIAKSKEQDYREALLREYKSFLQWKGEEEQRFPGAYREA